VIPGKEKAVRQGPTGETRARPELGKGPNVERSHGKGATELRETREKKVVATKLGGRKEGLYHKRSSRKARATKRSVNQRQIQKEAARKTLKRELGKTYRPEEFSKEKEVGTAKGECDTTKVHPQLPSERKAQKSKGERAQGALPKKRILLIDGEHRSVKDFRNSRWGTGKPRRHRREKSRSRSRTLKNSVSQEREKRGLVQGESPAYSPRCGYDQKGGTQAVIAIASRFETGATTGTIERPERGGLASKGFDEGLRLGATRRNEGGDNSVQEVLEKNKKLEGIGENLLVIAPLPKNPRVR